MDFDGVSNDAEIACGMNATNPDSDGDGIPDGVEYRNCADTDKDGKPDAMDKDSDNDGIPDGTEDANHNGRWDAGETNALVQDTDGDGLQDGFELHYLSGTSDTCTVATGACTNAWLFTAASSNTPTTSALDKDTDDDGIADNVEEAGSWCYVGEAGCTYGSGTNGARVTDPTKADTDAYENPAG
jgi:large repetitive protein